MKESITYFDEPGKSNTGEALAIARKRALALGIRQVLVASSHGYTAGEAARIFTGSGIEVIAVSISEGYHEEGWCMSAEERSALENAGVKVLTSQSSLGGGVGEAFDGESSLQTKNRMKRLSLISSWQYPGLPEAHPCISETHRCR